MEKIVINGSPKKDGTTAKLCQRFNLPIVHLADGIEEAVAEIMVAEDIVFATPVYWFNVSALMKQLIEALPESPNFPCLGKRAYFFAVCNEDGGQQAINQMFAPLNHMGFTIPPWACHFYNLNTVGKSEDNWQEDFSLEITN